MTDHDLTLPDAMPQWIVDHVQLYLEDPKAAHLWDSKVAGGPGPLPTLLLITTGRASGKRRPVPLIYKKIGADYVVIGSKGGAPEHPAWYENLEANPEAEIRVAEDRFRVRARTAAGEEREDKWNQLTAVYPPYAQYQQSAGDRLIPVVVLEVAGRLARG